MRRRVHAPGARAAPPAPAGDPLPVRHVHTCRFDSGAGDVVEVDLPRPAGIGSRRLVDAWLLRRAVEAGARHVAERVTAVRPGAVRTAKGGTRDFDVVVGADGASSVVRRTFLGPLPPGRLAMAAGWYARGDADMVVRFTPGLAGYLWLFPRPDHVGVGICAPLASVRHGRCSPGSTRRWRAAFPAMSDHEAERTPTSSRRRSADPALDPRDRRRRAGRWSATPPRSPTRSPARASTSPCARRRSSRETLHADGGPRGYAERAWRSSAATS